MLTRKPRQRLSNGSVDWRRDPKAVRRFVRLAEGEGLLPASIDQGRLVLLRYNRFLEERYGKDIDAAGWKEFGAYKAHLGRTTLAKTTIFGYLSYVATYYRLKADANQSQKALDTYIRTRFIGRIYHKRSEPFKPFRREVLDRIIRVAEASYRRGGRCREDFVFIMSLIYTGGRAQLYGLRTSDVNFKEMEIKVPQKGGHSVAVPLHPHLAEILRAHLRSRRDDSEFVFRHGHDTSTRLGQKANRQNAWRVCKRIQQAAGLTESVHPHRFRKTLATEGRRLGLDPQFIQTILGHRYVALTLDLYASVDREDLKREFAKVDFSRPLGPSLQSDAEARVNALVALAPEGNEEAWTSVVRSLLAFVGLTQAEGSTQSNESGNDARHHKVGTAKSFRSEKERWVPNRLSVKGSESLYDHVALLKVGNNRRKR